MAVAALSACLHWEPMYDFDTVSPTQLQLEPKVPGSCGDLETAEIAAAAINMVLDVVIVLLPLPIVWKLQMPTQRKIGITITFALGLRQDRLHTRMPLTLLGQAVRSYSPNSIAGINLARIIKVLTCSLQDFTYCTRDSAILTVAEMALGIILACVPTFVPIFSRRHFISPTQKHYGSKNGGTLGSKTHVQLRSYRDDSFGGQSLEGLHRQELGLGKSLRYDDSRSHAYIHADTSKPAYLMHNSSDGIGVRSVLEVTSDRYT